MQNRKKNQGSVSLYLGFHEFFSLIKAYKGLFLHDKSVPSRLTDDSAIAKSANKIQEVRIAFSYKLAQ